MKRAGHVNVCGQRIPVCVGTVDDHPALASAYGCYDLDTGIIWIAKDCPKHEVSFWLRHEQLHAMLQLSGASRATAALLGLDVDRNTRDAQMLERWEETFIRIITPHLESDS